jgi:pSer/pThr/pTyr-binding forkhead associated (FHA) protein
MIVAQSRRSTRRGRASYASPQSVQPWLEAFGRRYPLGTGLTFGRGAENQIALNDAQVSRNHARIYFQNGYWVLQDLNSANGTIVNGQQIALHYLQEGDRITMGSSTFIFHAR